MNIYGLIIIFIIILIIDVDMSKNNKKENIDTVKRYYGNEDEHNYHIHYEDQECCCDNDFD